MNPTPDHDALALARLSGSLSCLLAGFCAAWELDDHDLLEKAYNKSRVFLDEFGMGQTVTEIREGMEESKR
jgi:hypothetical protein